MKKLISSFLVLSFLSFSLVIESLPFAKSIEASEGLFDNGLEEELLEENQYDTDPASIDYPEEEMLEEEESGVPLYIDGQKQTYTGEPFWAGGELFVPLPAAVQVLNEFEDTASVREESVPYSEDGARRYLEDEELVQEVGGQESVAVRNIEGFGVQAYWYDNPPRLHFETADLLEVEGLRPGVSQQTVENSFNVEWGSAYSSNADYIGYYGDLHEFTYTDRYGHERSGDVPDIQFELKDNELTYMILSSDDYQTTKGIEVGDQLFDVRRMYGQPTLEERIDGKQVYIYHVRDGSLWFISDEDQDIERIGLWKYQVETETSVNDMDEQENSRDEE
ncbi:hypothetical protein [Salsuginibacillus kocurii]|uniref:hypothetical protein n=1 Tax=Salsuginibacillus kocurii TaxID=427078 RepID=UPI00037D4919|nr:hypothetical protein [Salsuginibacillus kocurii]